jgi:5-methylcytosine-specific restriction endonuclease McrA
MASRRQETKDDRRGSTRNRRARKQWMLTHYGNGHRCQCTYCPVTLTYDTVQADRIVPGTQGGTYRRENVTPACGPCNRARSDNAEWRPALGALVLAA